MIVMQDSGFMIPMQDSGSMIPMQDSGSMIHVPTFGSMILLPIWGYYVGTQCKGSLWLQTSCLQDSLTTALLKKVPQLLQ